MSPRDVVRTALGNLARHTARTLLTTVGVIVGILTIVTMVSLGHGVQLEMRGAFDTVGLELLRLYPVTEQRGAYDPFGEAQRTQLLTPELVRELEAREDVVEVIPYLRLPSGMRVILVLDGQEMRAEPSQLSPASVPDPFEVPPRTLAGVDEPPAEGGGLVVGQGLLEELGYGAGDWEGLIGREVALVLYAPRGETATFAFKIAGIDERRWDDLSLALPDRLVMLEWWYSDPEYLAHRGYDVLFVRAKSLNAATHIVDRLAGLGFKVESVKAMLDLANRGMIIMQTLLGSVGGLALLVASLGIANTMIMAVYERTREIGILKAVGAAPAQIRALFVVEASLIGCLGGVIGTILGWLLGKGLNRLILAIFEWQEVNIGGTFFVVPWWLMVGALAFATLVGLLAGLYPAARAARLAPLDALRYE
jgi:ABC-type lipoprotein release transport system permease subunit